MRVGLRGFAYSVHLITMLPVFPVNAREEVWADKSGAGRLGKQDSLLGLKNRLWLLGTVREGLCEQATCVVRSWVNKIRY